LQHGGIIAACIGTTTLMVAHLITIDAQVSQMGADELIEARQLMDEKLEKWQRNIGE